MNILITGGAGFIGRALSVKLIQQHKVEVLDLFQSPVTQAKFTKGSVMDKERVDAALKGKDVVVNLASVVGVEKNEVRPTEALDVNITGTRNVLESCRLNDVSKIIYSSSSEVYGEPIKVPIYEDDSPIPITTYGIAKLAAEEYIKAYSKAYGIKYTIFRFFSVYGPGQSTDFVLPRFVVQALKNEQLNLHGDGTQVRAFCHVDDIVNGISLALTRGDNETINLGNDLEPISMKDLVHLVIQLTSSKSRVNLVPFAKTGRARGKEILNRIPNIEKAKKLLDYSPKINLKQGIESVIAHYRDKL